MVAMRNTEVLEPIDEHPFARGSERDIAASHFIVYHRTRKERQSSYDAHKASVEKRRRTVRSNAKPWTR